MQTFSVEEVTALLLGKLKLMAEQVLGQAVGKAIIAIPMRFNNDQKQAVKDAATIAGFDEVELIGDA